MVKSVGEIINTITRYIKNNAGTKLTVTAFSLLCGITGIIAGYFEILQGNVSTDGFIISTIGPEHSMWKTYSIYELMEPYSAITIVPNFLVTGILAIIISSLLIIWVVFFIHRKHAVIIFLLLSIIQLIVGGAFVIDLAIITSITATRINKPLNWWRTHLSNKIRNVLSKIWCWSLLFFIIISGLLLGITIIGVDNTELIGSLDVVATLMFIPLILLIVGGFACDIKRNEIIN